MPDDLQNLLTQNGKKILFVGIGNLLRKDDGAGVYISNNIIAGDNVDSLTVEVSLENYIGKINSLNPDILVLIDCVDLKQVPGTYRILRVGETADLTFNTHNISLARISEFFSADVHILGIQPADIGFGENISFLVRSVCDEIINLINNRR